MKMRDILMLFESTHAYLYHGTGEGAFRRIREKGITLNGGKAYFSDNEKYSLTYSIRKGAPLGPRVLRVVKDDRFVEDQSNAGGDYISSEPIPPSEIELKTNDGWVPIQRYSDETVGIMPIEHSKQIVKEDTVENLGALRDCIASLLETLPYTFPENEVVDFYGHQARGYNGLKKKFDGTSFAPAIELFGKTFFIIDNREFFVGSKRMGAFVSRPHNQVIIYISALLVSSGTHTKQEVLDHRSDGAIKSFRAIVLHELRHLFQAALFSDYFEGKPKQDYKTEPVEIDAAWHHHLEDFSPAAYVDPLAYADDVMKSFSGYKSLTSRQKEHFRRKTIRYYFETKTTGAPVIGATAKDRLAQKREDLKQGIIAAFQRVSGDVDLRSRIEGYEADNFFFPQRSFQGAAGLIKTGATPNANTAAILLLIIALTIPEEQIGDALGYLVKTIGLNVEQGIEAIPVAFARFDHEAIKRFIQAATDK